jgi:hypothetical protein
MIIIINDDCAYLFVQCGVTIQWSMDMDGCVGGK